MTMPVYPRIAVLVDLPGGTTAGGHVKYWELMAQAVVKEKAPIDLTVYFLGDRADDVLSPQVRLRYLPPFFSTAHLKFLPYVPAHTDLAPLHPRLAKELPSYDLLHATDAYFAFARTAERVSRQHGIPLVTSFHTDTPAYAELFTHEMLLSLFGKRAGARIDSLLKISKRERAKKNKRLGQHLQACSAVFAMRPADKVLAQKYIPEGLVRRMRMGVDKDLFVPLQDARAEIERDYNIPPGKFLTLFVGRVDAGKNMPLLVQACAKTIENGVKLHLIVAGLGPMSAEVKAVLGDNATLAGFLSPEKLAKLYAAVDCLSMVSDIEIGGLIGAEALSCGCPVLASALNGMPVLYGNSPAIQEVESNVSSWTDALTRMSENKEQRTAMHDAAVIFRREKLGGWPDLLKEDFLPVWEALVRKDKTKCSANAS
ncbi:MAG: glycosyltransferase [Bdellovibrionales bacterium]